MEVQSVPILAVSDTIPSIPQQEEAAVLIVTDDPLEETGWAGHTLFSTSIGR